MWMVTFYLVLSALCVLEKICLTVPKLQTSSVSNNKSYLASDYVPGNYAKPFRLITSQQLQRELPLLASSLADGIHCT